MRPPRFWSAHAGHPAALALRPAGYVYGCLTAARMDRPGQAGSIPVVCVGNFTLGGAGKTPTALHLAQLLRTLGRRPAFLSRGYGGRLPGPVRVDPDRHGAHEVGDEPLLLARAGLAVVARDRVAGAGLCAEAGADAIVMDDGLQNPALRKDLALAVVDAGTGLGNGCTFPAGPLRAPLHRQWPHVHGLVLVGEGAPGEAVAQAALRRGLPVHRARVVPDAKTAAALRGQPVLAFAGLGRPDKFFATLEEIGARLVAARAFPDHHAYREGDLAALAAQAARAGARLVTTRKDRVRLPAAFAQRVTTLDIALAFHDEAPLRGRLAALFAGMA